jgi:hypothetical protein
MCYSLPATSFTRQELAIMKFGPFMSFFLPWGSIENAARVVLGSAFLGGNGLRYLHVEQGFLKMLALLEHIQ